MLDERGRDIGSTEMAELVGDAGKTVCSRFPFTQSYDLADSNMFWVIPT